MASVLVSSVGILSGLVIGIPFIVLLNRLAESKLRLRATQTSLENTMDSLEQSIVDRLELGRRIAGLKEEHQRDMQCQSKSAQTAYLKLAKDHEKVLKENSDLVRMSIADKDRLVTYEYEIRGHKDTIEAMENRYRQCVDAIKVALFSLRSLQCGESDAVIDQTDDSVLIPQACQDESQSV